MADIPAWRVRPNAPRSGTALGPIDEIEVGQAKEYRFGRGRSAFSMLVVRLDADDARAYLNLCPHFSLPLNQEPDRFTHGGHIRCVQHFAIFRLADGYCVSGACEGRHLDAIPLARTAEGIMAIV